MSFEDIVNGLLRNMVPVVLFLGSFYLSLLLVSRLEHRGNRKIDDRFRFAIWRWQDILSVEDRVSLYLRKLYLWRTPLQQTALHWIKQPDPGRDPHDHPRDFISIVLRGRYTEERYSFDVGARKPSRIVKTVRLAGDIAYRRAEDLHRIVEVQPNTLTLVLWGRRRREWGFRTAFGWVHWRRYLGLDQ